MDSKKTIAAIGGFLMVIVVAVLGYFGLNANTSPNTPGTFPEPRSDGPWYEIYFTDPACPPDGERVDGVDETVAADIRAAELQVDIAAFDLDSTSIIDALIDARAAGVDVRVVVDDEHTPAATINRLRRNGISVVEDQRSGLMHNKFVVVDGRFVWTGSLNFSSNGAYCNNNNLVRFDEPRLAANYLAEMEEMYFDRAFGPTSPHATPNERLFRQGVLIESYFGPETSVAPIMTDALYNAEREILFMVFSLTNESVGEALLNRAEDGIVVQGVFETVGSETAFSYFPPLLDLGYANVDVRQDGNPQIMHHKVFIIDGATVVFGSYNPTASGNDVNDENVVIVHDPIFASFFLEEFEAVWAEAREPGE